MMRSLYAGVSGLRNHQTRMDVIGNNIANVNTVGFKGSRVTFQDMLSQSMKGASAGNGTRGGTNPMQVGLGMGVASIDTLFTDGSFQPTGKPTDLSIQGSGFFILTDGNNRMYTRAGNFDFDNEGNYLVPGTGYKVAGWVADDSGAVNANGPVTGIKIPVGATMAAKVSTQTSSAGNLSADAPVGTIVQAPVELYDSLGIAHKMNTTYYKIDNTTWLSKTTVGDASITTGTQWQQITFNTNGSFKEAVTINPPKTTAQTLDIPNLAMDKTPNAVHTANHTVFDASGTPHAISMTFTTNATGDGWSYKISESGVKNPTVVEGTMDWDTASGTYVQTPHATPAVPLANPIAVKTGDSTYSFNFTPNAPGTAFNASLNQQTYHTNAVTTGLTISNFQMDSDTVEQTTPPVEIVDADGNVNTFSITFKQNGAGWDYNYTINGTAEATAGTVTWDAATSTYAGLPTNVSIGNPPIAYPISITANPAGPASNPTTSLSTTASQATLDNFDITPTTKATPMSIKANLNTLTSYAGESTVQVEKDGYGAGTLNSKYIDTSGVIVGNFSNGQSKILGQVALATFNNPSGLDKVGDNLFSKSVNSGDAKVGTAGSGGRGTFNPGNLEMSNVDLAQEFSTMIITQRGFQANSKIITTTDQMLEELANLKR